MTDTPIKHSSAWTTFTTVSFVLAAGMMAGGIYFLEASFFSQGFLRNGGHYAGEHLNFAHPKQCVITKKPANWSTKLKTQKQKNC